MHHTRTKTTTALTNFVVNYDQQTYKSSDFVEIIIGYIEQSLKYNKNKTFTIEKKIMIDKLFKSEHTCEIFYNYIKQIKLLHDKMYKYTYFSYKRSPEILNVIHNMHEILCKIEYVLINIVQLYSLDFIDKNNLSKNLQWMTETLLTNDMIKKFQQCSGHILF